MEISGLEKRDLIEIVYYQNFRTSSPNWTEAENTVNQILDKLYIKYID